MPIPYKCPNNSAHIFNRVTVPFNIPIIISHALRDVVTA